MKLGRVPTMMRIFFVKTVSFESNLVKVEQYKDTKYSRNRNKKMHDFFYRKNQIRYIIVFLR